jgi:hypothetical protein
VTGVTPTARSARCDEVMTLIFEAKKTQGTSELISNKTPENIYDLKTDFLERHILRSRTMSMAYPPKNFAGNWPLVTKQQQLTLWFISCDPVSSRYPIAIIMFLV